MDTLLRTFPAELWAIVVGKMFLEDGVRLSSTCRSLRGVLDARENMHMLPNMDEGTWPWLVKHWGSAKRLTFSTECPDSWVAPSQAAGLTNLRTLHIIARARENESGERFPEWLAGVLHHCSTLRVLDLSSISPSSWPVLAALRHLAIGFCEPQAEEVLNSLLGMHGCLGLQTMRLLLRGGP